MSILRNHNSSVGTRMPAVVVVKRTSLHRGQESLPTSAPPSRMKWHTYTCNTFTIVIKLQDTYIHIGMHVKLQLLSIMHAVKHVRKDMHSA